MTSRLRTAVAIVLGGAAIGTGCKSATDAGGSDVVTITIRNSSVSSRYPTCVAFSPSPVSVKVKQGFRFSNSDTAAVTLFQKANPQPIPVVTVGPGKTSSSFSYDNAGYYVLFTLRDCGAGDWPGVAIYVTVG